MMSVCVREYNEGGEVQGSSRGSDVRRGGRGAGGGGGESVICRRKYI